MCTFGWCIGVVKGLVPGVGLGLTTQQSYLPDLQTSPAEKPAIYIIHNV